MNWGQSLCHVCHHMVSVVINDLHIVGIAFFPSEADTPLIVDPNTVLPEAIAG